jgi:hypothetical protein
MKRSNFNIFLFLLIFFLAYEITAIKLNYFSFTLYLFSILFISNDSQNDKLINLLTFNYNKILSELAYNNDLLKLTNILKNSDININNLKLITLADIIQKENEYFYINKGSEKGIKIKDIVVNEDNLIGIIIQVYPKLSKAKYILSSDFEIISIIKETSSIGLTKYLNNNLVFVPIDIYSFEKKIININKPYSVLTYGYYSIPSGIPIGYIYDSNSLNITIKKDLKNSIHTLVLRRL